jgi:DNA-binding MurR/RpiR family transcriptional regulator
VQNTQQNFEHFVTTDLSNVGEAVELLKEAPHVWIVAEHMGYDLANFMAKNLQDLGISSSAFYPSMSETASVISQMKEGEVLLALVNEGPSIDAGYAVKLAKDKGITTLCLTGSGVALPAREADLAIIVPIKTPAGVPSFGAEMLVLSIMWEALASSLEEQTADNLKTRRDNMAKILKVRAETPEYEVSSPHDIWGDHLPTE